MSEPRPVDPLARSPLARSPIARSPIAPAPPVTVLAGWEVSGRRASAGETLTDCTPLAKVQLRAPAGGQVAGALGVPFGRAARARDGTLVVGSGPGEWLLLAPPGQAPALASRLAGIAAGAQGESASWVDLTHGRALIRLNGPASASVLAKLCGIDLSDAVIPDGAAFRSSVASLATDVIRDDAGGSADAGSADAGNADAGGADGGSADAGSADAGSADAGGADGGRGARSYLLHCERSSGQYLFDALLRAGGEFGIETDGFRLPTARPGPARPGPASHGPASPGPASPGPASPGPAWPGPAWPGPAWPGPASPGPP